MDFVLSNPQWFVAGAIVVIGLFVLGAGDLMRFRLRRVWAISGVCFAESIRRRVLWITPLAIVGVIIVAQLQRPLDEQDAVRQTTKFCLFATGLLVSVTSIILACTNLPKEIENRVIYTVVTKPTTRLEIVLGKIVGFARVSGSILIIMGLFTLGYLGLRAWTMNQAIGERLAAGTVDPLSRPTLEHYRKAGLLNAKSYAFPRDLQAAGPITTDGRIWFDGSSEQTCSVRFHMPADFPVPTQSGIDTTQTALRIRIRIGAQSTKPTTRDANTPTPFLRPQYPFITVSLTDANFNTLNVSSMVSGSKGIEITPDSPAQGVIADVPVGALSDLVRVGDFYVSVNGVSPDTRFWVGAEPIQILVDTAVTGATIDQLPYAAIPGVASKPGEPFFQGRQGTYGQQLKGTPDLNDAPVAVYRFRDMPTPGTQNGLVPMELRVGIERSGLDAADDNDDPTILSVQTRDPATGKLSTPIEVRPDSGRTAYFGLPAADLYNGNFDVLIRNTTTGHWAGLQPIVPGARSSLSVVVDNRPMGFVLNLVKSLFILWLMSILVIVISIFCSTFLSWPIAVVLTLVILLGHWGVGQLSDATQPGIGNQVATDFGFRDPAAAKVVSSSVETLSKALNSLAKVLPDISQFSATEDIERGIAIPSYRLVDALGVVGMFGLPLAVLAYVFLKHKEVAP